MDTTYLSDWGTALMASLAAALALLFSSVPKIMGFLIIVLAGWLVASLVERAVAAVLRTIHFNDLSERSGLADFVRKMGTDTDASGVIGLVAKWFIRLIALVVAFDALGLPAVSDVLRHDTASCRSPSGASALAPSGSWRSLLFRKAISDERRKPQAERRGRSNWP